MTYRDCDPRRNMNDANSALGFIDVLSTWSTQLSVRVSRSWRRTCSLATHGRYFEIGWVHLNPNVRFFFAEVW